MHLLLINLYLLSIHAHLIDFLDFNGLLDSNINFVLLDSFKALGLKLYGSLLKFQLICRLLLCLGKA